MTTPNEIPPTLAPETPLAITGMTCTSCARRVERALRSLDEVEHVRIDLRSGRAFVRHHGAEPAALVEAVHAAGYGAVLDAPPAVSEEK